MEPFIVSARKYRPKRFSDVIGQEHVTTTLRNAIKHQELAQVFLFCGLKGTGKTTCARILAQVINCQASTPSGDPCQACQGCQHFSQNSSLHVHELDAASHNSVDDIRHLVAQVRYPAPYGKKVFIIDEAHMLSNAASNALLKTLEDTPSHVVFIFATTERHKIIAPVQSRCQIFDFHPLETPKIVGQLARVARSENIDYEPDSLTLIARKAEGSLRDALSMFDLVITFESSRKLTLQGVKTHLHILDHDTYTTLVYALSKGKIGDALHCYDQVTRLGFDGQHFLTGLGDHLRYLLLCQEAPSLSIDHLGQETIEAYHKQAHSLTPHFLHDALVLAYDCALTYKESPHKRLHIEVALLKIARFPDRIPLSEITRDAPQAVQKSTVPSSAKNTPSSFPPASQHADHPKHVSSSTTGATHSTTPVPQSLQKAKTHFRQKEAQEGTVQLPQVSTSSAHPMPTSETLKEHWQNFVKSLGSSAPPATMHLLKQPYTLEDTAITMTLTNTLEQEQLLLLKPALLDYLRKRMHDTRLVIKAEMTPPSDKKIPYTDQQKWTYLLKKHPQLAELQKAIVLEAC